MQPIFRLDTGLPGSVGGKLARTDRILVDNAAIHEMRENSFKPSSDIRPPPTVPKRNTLAKQFPTSDVIPSVRLTKNAVEVDRKDVTAKMVAALRESNKDLERQVAKMHAHTNRLKREIQLLQRHLTETQNPIFETFEADILTRLIEVAYTNQHHESTAELSFASDTVPEKEAITRAYINAAKQIKESTMTKLGLDDQYYKAILRYEEIAPYRSSDPFINEVPFARWLIQEMNTRPEKFAFWSRLYPICYGRHVEVSAELW